MANWEWTKYYTQGITTMRVVDIYTRKAKMFNAVASGYGYCKGIMVFWYIMVLRSLFRLS